MVKQHQRAGSELVVVPMDLAILRDIMNNSKNGTYGIRDLRMIKSLSNKISSSIPKPPDREPFPVLADPENPTEEEKKAVEEYNAAWTQAVKEFDELQVPVVFNEFELAIIKTKLQTAKFNENYIDAVDSLCKKFGI